MNTIEQAAQRFIFEAEHLRGFTKSTLKNYRVILGAFDKFAEPQSIEEITTDTIRSFILNGRSERGWKPRTTHTYYKKLRVFFGWCVQQGYITDNPARDIDLPKLEQRLPKDLSKEQAMRLLETVYNYPYQSDYLRYRNHAMFACYLFTGLRKTELLNLRLMDVDIDNKTIFVNQGKGRKDRIVPMSFTLAQSLARYLQERQRLRKANPAFFVSWHGDRGMTEHGLLHIVKNIQRASGLKFTIHQLRHTFATLMSEGGCDIVSISRFLGHAKIETTMTYVWANGGHLRNEMAKHPLDIG